MAFAVRYIQDFINGKQESTFLSQSSVKQWSRIRAVSIDSAGAETDHALGRVATGLNGLTYTGLSNVTNNDLTTHAQCTIIGTGGVQIDLGAIYNLDYIQVSHFYNEVVLLVNHSLLISANGSNWYRVVSGDSQLYNIDSGYKYWLPFFLNTDEQIDDLDISKIAENIDNLRDRKVSPVTITNPAAPDVTVKGVDLIALKDALDDYINVNFSGAFTDPYGRILKNDIQKFSENLFLASQVATSCTAGCSQMCLGGCSGQCFGTCGVGCGAACSETCGLACENICGGDCSGECSSGCSGGCGGACSGGCAGRCRGLNWDYGGLGICAGTCDTGCTYHCGHSSCSHECGGACTHSCGSGCFNVCGGACINGCATSCGGGCRTACQNTCQTSCKSGCGGNCVNGCGANCVGFAQ